MGPELIYVLRRNSVGKTLRIMRNVVGIAGLVLAGYVFISSIPDVGRYIKISSM